MSPTRKIDRRSVFGRRRNIVFSNESAQPLPFLEPVQCNKLEHTELVIKDRQMHKKCLYGSLTSITQLRTHLLQLFTNSVKLYVLLFYLTNIQSVGQVLAQPYQNQNTPPYHPSSRRSNGSVSSVTPPSAAVSASSTLAMSTSLAASLHLTVMCHRGHELLLL